MKRVVFLGGNGHADARLSMARRALAARGASVDLCDAGYPGFEGRPRSPSFDAFLNAVSARMRGADHVYATGIGGLLALALRARGEHTGLPFLFQGPVLWGLERRLMPRVMRLLPAERVLRWVFSSPRYQAHFLAKQFTAPPPPEVATAFFAGYATCTSLGDFFAWLTPGLLRHLEASFAGRPEALGHVTVWWGGRDRVVETRELAWTEEALGVSWPCRVFEGWGHYPMIDAPDAWAEALCDALATA